MTSILNEYLLAVKKMIEKNPSRRETEFERLFYSLREQLSKEQIVITDMQELERIAKEMDKHPARRRRPQCLGAIEKMITEIEQPQH